jgi:hypothetical protein
MAKWEYMVWQVCRGTVLAVDDKVVGRIVAGFMGIQSEGPAFRELLSQAGDQGWEVVGMSPYHTEPDIPDMQIIVLLKRLKPS